MVVTCHDLEQLANDRSVLESFSASHGWSLLTAEGSGVIEEAGMTVGERKEIRQKFGQYILVTDMAEHFRFLLHGNVVEKVIRRMMEHRGSGGSAECDVPEETDCESGRHLEPCSTVCDYAEMIRKDAARDAGSACEGSREQSVDFD
ncbi:hypothetical protein BLNAU_24715 [Blattamonas nauphoetae]|uniref:PDEase domain-containing protein n=1 Tax=Blattamonas nauphoetae TaxID=2049346 RepID=A0ABQ9WLP4_9EUKA|nr:hypothetical protein BLNAU_24715 [Blattamonas nauphoetae]